jgi:hypothetical protein
VLSTTALESLAKHLASVAAGFSISSAPLGRPDAVRKAAEESEKLFQDYAKGKPTKQDAYAAALAFMRGQDLDEQHLHLIAGALSEPIREEAGARPVGRSRNAEDRSASTVSGSMRRCSKPCRYKRWN